MDQNLSYSLKPSVNPLMYSLKVSWATPVSGEILGGVWNLLQIWITKNDAISVGTVSTTPTSMALTIGIKRRLGSPKNACPWE